MKNVRYKTYLRPNLLPVVPQANSLRFFPVGGRRESLECFEAVQRLSEAVTS